jgi:hypothetical protein
MKSALVSKTIWVNVISLILAVLQLSEVVTFVPPAYNGLMAAVLSVLNLVLRFLTTQPVTLATPAGAQRAMYAAAAKTNATLKHVPPHRGGNSSALILLVGLSLSAAGCAARQQQIALHADQAVHATLAGVQDTVDALCVQKVMTPEDCVVFNQRLVPALQAGDAYNRAVRAERAGQVGDLLGAIGRLTGAVTTLVPEKYRPDLLERLQAIINGVFTEVQK